MGWLSKVLGPKSAPETSKGDSPPTPDLEAMSLPEILNWAAPQKGRKWTFDEMGALVKRLTDIAYGDSDVEESEREVALRLAEATVEDIEAGLSLNAPKLAAFQKWWRFHVNFQRQTGYGSLAFKVRKGPQGDGVFDTLVARENSHLVADFVEIHRDVWEPIKADILRRLIRERAKRVAPNNAVFVLWWLLHTRDQTAWNFLSENERANLLEADRDYLRAREVLVGYGLVPVHSTAPPYLPLPEVDKLLYIVPMAMKDEEPSGGVTKREVEERSSIYGDGSADGVLTVLMALRGSLALNLLRGIYGREFAESIREKLPGILVTSWEAVKGLCDRVEAAVRFSRSASDGQRVSGADCSVAAAMLELFISDEKDDDSVKQAKLNMVVSMVGTELYYFPPYFRYLVGCCVHDEKKGEYLYEDSLTALET